MPQPRRPTTRRQPDDHDHPPEMLAKFQTWTRANPLLVLALAAVAGVIAADAGLTANWRSGSLLVAAFVVPFGALILGRAVWLVPGCALVFAFIHETRLDETFRHPLVALLKKADQPLQAVVRGSLLPEYDSTGDRRAHALCQTSRIEIPSLGLTFSDRLTLMLRLPAGVAFPGAGIFEINGSLELPRTSSNPGAFNAVDYMLRSGRAARFEVETMRRTNEPGNVLACAFLETAQRCRQWIGVQLSHDLEDDPQTAAVIRAMALGVSAEADEEIEDAFRNSGTLHVFAVSGLHVGLLGIIAITLLRQFGLRRGLSISVMIVLVFAYAFITGWRPSAARAAFMVAVLMGASLADRESSLQNSLGAAALLLLASDTHQVFMPGFQLSFGVLWASSIGSAPLLERLMPLTNLDPFLPPQLANWKQRLWSQLRRSLATTFSVSVAAWAGSLPFMLVHFQAVTPVAVAANCVLVPLSFLSLSLTCVSVSTAVAGLGGVQLVLNNANWALVRMMMASAAWFAGLPGGNFHFQTGGTDTTAPVMWRMLEVPHGGAANHLRIGSSHWLFDTGDESGFRRILRPCLHSTGVNTLDGVFLSHNDADHVGGVLQVVDTFGAPQLFCSTQEPGPVDNIQTTLRRLHDSLRPASLHHLAVDDTLPLGHSGPVQVSARVLYPDHHAGHSRADDRAMVVLLQAGRWRLLWMSDAGWDAEKHLVTSTASLRCDVLVRSQHAQDRAPTEEFLLKVQPRIILCGSDGRDANAMQPASLRDFASRHDTLLLDTWNDGCIEVHFGHQELRITAARNGRKEILTLKD